MNKIRDIKERHELSGRTKKRSDRREPVTAFRGDGRGGEGAGENPRWPDKNVLWSKKSGECCPVYPAVGGKSEVGVYPRACTLPDRAFYVLMVQ